MLRVPREAAAGLAWHPPVLYSVYDAWRLARRAKRLFHSIAPQVPPSRGRGVSQHRQRLFGGRPAGFHNTCPRRAPPATVAISPAAAPCPPGPRV